MTSPLEDIRRNTRRELSSREGDLLTGGEGPKPDIDHRRRRGNGRGRQGDPGHVLRRDPDAGGGGIAIAATVRRGVASCADW